MTNHEDIDKKVLGFIIEAIPINLKESQIKGDMRLQSDLGLDSISMLMLMFKFEQAFGFDLEATDINVTLQQIQTVSDLLAVSQKLTTNVERSDLD